MNNNVNGKNDIGDKGDKIAGVITIPLFGSDDSRRMGLSIALEELMRLGIRIVVVVYDRKMAAAKAVEPLIKELTIKIESPQLRVIVLKVDLYDTCPRWRTGVVRALEEPEIDRVIVFPADLKQWTDENRKGMDDLVAQSDPQSLVIGDYGSPDLFKSTFSDRYGLPAIRTMFGNSIADPIRNIQMIRSEIYILGRDVYEAYEKSGAYWICDSTAELLVYLAQRGDQLPRFSIRIGNLGEIKDDAARRNPLGQMEQIVRFGSQVMLDAILWEIFDNLRKDPAAQAARCAVLRGKLNQLHGVILHALDEMVIPPIEADPYRAVYVMTGDSDFGQWLLSLWNENLLEDDPLRLLLEPNDLRGEVSSWGGPHITCGDALTIIDPEEFARIIKRICAACYPPAIHPIGLDLWKPGALVLKLESPDLALIRGAMIRAARHLIARSPVGDESWQKAEWWIRKVCNPRDLDKRLDELWAARRRYLAAGSPPIPRSRHFGMGHLVGLSRAIDDAPKNSRESKQRSLDYFLKSGEPSWYAHPKSYHPHITIASGIRFNDEAERTNMLEQFRQTLWQPIQAKLHGVLTPSYLSILGEDEQNKVNVQFYDQLTATFVGETRPGFREIDRAEFRSRPSITSEFSGK